MKKEKKNTIQLSIFEMFKEEDSFTTKEAVNEVTEHLNVNPESVRARLYEGVKSKLFEKIERGIYKVNHYPYKDSEAIFIQGDGRNLDFLSDQTVDCIITDHPYEDKKSHAGGNRSFADYDAFQYTLEDFKEKFRVLKDGSFLVEFLPTENANNYEYLYEIKRLAKEAGFHYYAKILWKKGSFVANTGRQEKKFEEIMIFSKGKARELKLDAKKNKQTAIKHELYQKSMSSYEVAKILEEKHLDIHYMSGAYGMLPAFLDYDPPKRSERVHQAEKPVEMLSNLLSFLTKKGEWILDSFAGSFNIAKACLLSARNVIAIEKDSECFARGNENITQWLSTV